MSCVNGSGPCVPISTGEKSKDVLTMILIRIPDDAVDEAKYSKSQGVTCEIGLGTQCKEHQRCVSTINHRSRNGVCVCEDGFTFKNDTETCILTTDNGNYL